jgi:YD repeat-containing protein
MRWATARSNGVRDTFQSGLLGTAQKYQCHHSFDETIVAIGNTLSVTRNAGNGVIANTFAYDVLGRKVQQSDPDTGLTSFEYNALGELTAQIDALGNRTEHAIDARGRVWRSTVKDFNGLTARRWRWCAMSGRRPPGCRRSALAAAAAAWSTSSTAGLRPATSART